MHDRVQQDFPQGIQRNRETVLAEDLPRGEAGAQGHGPFQKRHALADHGKGIHVLLPVVDDFAGDLRAAESAHLQQALRIVGQELLAVEHQGGPRQNAAHAEPEPVENLADVAAGVHGDAIMLDGQLAGPQDFPAVQVLQRQALDGLVFPAPPAWARSRSRLSYFVCAILRVVLCDALVGAAVIDERAGIRAGFDRHRKHLAACVDGDPL